MTGHQAAFVHIAVENRFAQAAQGELFQLFFVYMVALPHQLEAQPVFHFPHFGYAFLQLIHADKLFRVVRLHFNMEGTAEEYHDFCCEILHAHRRES